MAGTTALQSRFEPPAFRRLPPPPPPSSPLAQKTMSAQRQADTKPEIAVRSALHRRGLRYRKHLAPLQGLRCKADVVFLRQQVAIFIDGCFWHGCTQHGTVPKANNRWWRQKIEGNQARDRRNDEVLEHAGWAVVRIWEHEDPEAAADRVMAVVRGRAS